MISVSVLSHQGGDFYTPLYLTLTAVTFDAYIAPAGIAVHPPVSLTLTNEKRSAPFGALLFSKQSANQ